MLYFAEMDRIRKTGVAFLCFTEDDSKFCGIFSSSDHSVYRLSGQHSNEPHVHINECCFEVMPTFYDVTFKLQSCDSVLTEIKSVIRTGGDNCKLECSELLDFTTDELLAGRNADDYIMKYFGSHLVNRGCYVCIGPMNFSYEKGHDPEDILDEMLLE